MKKLLFTIAAIAVLVFVSCGSKSKTKTETAEPLVDTTALAPDLKLGFDALSTQLTNALKSNDAESVTKALANLTAMYKTLANSGQLDELKRYGMLAKNLVEEYAGEIKNLATEIPAISKLYSNIEALPVSANTTLDEAKAAVSDEAISMASESFQKGAQAGATAEAAAEALKNAPAAAKETMNEALSDTKEAANDAANVAKKDMEEAANNTKEAANQAAKSAKKEMSDAVNNTKEAASDAAKKAKNKLGL